MGVDFMALVKCPECGKEISNKAMQCPYCGCPKSEWESMNDIAVNTCEPEIIDYPEETIVECRLNMVIHFCGKNISIVDNERNVYSGGINKLRILSIEKPTSCSYGEIRVSFPKEKPGIFFSGDSISMRFANSFGFDISKRYLAEKIEEYDKHQEYIKEYNRNVAERKRKKKEEAKRLKNTPHCPKCSSTNLQYLGEDNVGGREAKTKTVTSLNLNPLKPFTLFNQKEKVVKKAREGIDLDRWRCQDCGKVFTTIK